VLTAEIHSTMAANIPAAILQRKRKYDKFFSAYRDGPGLKAPVQKSEAYVHPGRSNRQPYAWYPDDWFFNHPPIPADDDIVDSDPGELQDDSGQDWLPSLMLGRGAQAEAPFVWKKGTETVVKKTFHRTNQRNDERNIMEWLDARDGIHVVRLNSDFKQQHDDDMKKYIVLDYCQEQDIFALITMRRETG
jgi:hypothetical protein